MSYRARVAAVTAVVGLLGLPASQAASIFLTPASSTVPLAAGTATFELFMDFTGTPTVGGGIDLGVTGAASFASFAPSGYFAGLPSAFSDHGVANADADYEIHFGDFAGLSGLNKLGDVHVSLAGVGTATINLAINQYYGDFYDLDSQAIPVALTGAEFSVVPLPSAAWMLLTGLGAAAGRSAWRRRAA